MRIITLIMIVLNTNRMSIRSTALGAYRWPRVTFNEGSLQNVACSPT